MKKGRLEEARRIMSILEDTTEDSEKVCNDIAWIEASLSKVGTGSSWDLFKMGEQRIFHRAVLAATGQMFQQFSGILTITFYATVIFQEHLHYSPIHARILSAAMEITQPIGGIIAFLTIDRYGRRPLMLFSATGLMICMACLAGTTSNPHNKAALSASVAFLFLFNLIFPIGLLGLTFLYATEVAPLHVRAAISGIGVAVNWLFSFIVTEVTPIGFDTITYRYYIVYAATNAFIIPVVYFCFPETNGRTLEEMDIIFAQSKTILDPPRIARVIPKRVAAQQPQEDAIADEIVIGKKDMRDEYKEKV